VIKGQQRWWDHLSTGQKVKKGGRGVKCFGGLEEEVPSSGNCHLGGDSSLPPGLHFGSGVGGGLKNQNPETSIFKKRNGKSPSRLTYVRGGRVKRDKGRCFQRKRKEEWSASRKGVSANGSKNAVENKGSV